MTSTIGKSLLYSSILVVSGILLGGGYFFGGGKYLYKRTFGRLYKSDDEKTCETFEDEKEFINAGETLPSVQDESLVPSTPSVQDEPSAPPAPPSTPSDNQTMT